MEDLEAQEAQQFNYCILEEQRGRRLDTVLAEAFPSYTRSFLQKCIRQGNVTVDGDVPKANARCKPGGLIRLCIPAPQETHIRPEPLPLDIVYEDHDVLVVNKPRGMVVHPSAGHTSGTLVNALLYHCQGDLSGINGELRPGIVHRIDKDTTGLLIVCKNDTAHNAIAAQLKQHTVTRRYYAIVKDNLKQDSGTIDAPIGRHPTERKKMAVNYRNGKRAVTHYTVLERFGSYTLIACELETGRTHQIRVHMASIQHPLLGDCVYGGVKQPYGLAGQCLHAKVIGFVHPTTGQYMEFDSPLPEYFQAVLQKLRINKRVEDGGSHE